MLELKTLEDVTDLEENEVLECKLAQGRDGLGALPQDFWETYSAFANTKGGTILLGLQESTDGTFILAGIEKPERLLTDLEAGLNHPGKVSQNILPAHAIQVKTLADRKYIQIYVPQAAAQDRPIYINGNPLTGSYQRCSSGDIRMDAEAVSQMIARHMP